MEAVKITRKDNCLTYALKRAGHGDLLDLIDDSDDLKDYFYFVNYGRESELQVGDIVLWEKDTKEDEQFWAGEITQEGLIVTKHVPVVRHLAVVESVSDGEIVSDVNTYGYTWPTICMKRLDDLAKEPDLLVRRKGTLRWLSKSQRKIRVQYLPAGMYMIHVQTTTGVETHRISIAR